MRKIRSVALKIFKCKKCGHVWGSSQKKPRFCACCKTPKWNSKRTRKIRTDCSYLNQPKSN